ncbi:bifunctional 2-polyprenyl-6-hydroxyphenol methylase/3-demethylubiquinol 3-O-methyltransferase UbiG [Chitinimonas koreensis]|uniref:bifunctional 2-polyprenyl-6-hydroxyphenol methylase/3-demethylubiquinol 3-O-methyltransferase UbiG n=1 Tax=Chitinimonas koreensis TaxID=356302 RepID=UPI00041D818B|nr:bifunctional 2-polyprenyl-6-hydroxyphenol methylase/3-demethylubiquinol 3-O-methyltransferase UbiG [Chitinimonas koreensis]QNM96434.1 3-demethylubiquinone-9 3-O-methyltransferase [Chitinimonas koreensis]
MPAIDNAIYDRIATTWWEEDGFMALLRTVLNPPRFAYFEHLLRGRLGMPAAGLRVLDVGCGGGLLSERFAALGCEVTGIDRSRPTLDAARAHAERAGLPIRYQEACAEALPFAAGEFDLVICCDVLEHVDDLDAVVAEIARVLKPGGLFFFDTINRTLRSRLIAVQLAQNCALTRLLPRDVHVWDKFIRPAELAERLERHGLPAVEFRGLSPRGNPFKLLLALLQRKLGRIGYAELGRRIGLAVGRDLSISYLGYAIRTQRG